jgi:hypothetical protein
MSTEELKVWLKDLDEAFEDMEYGSYEWDCATADIEYVIQALRERGVR